MSIVELSPAELKTPAEAAEYLGGIKAQTLALWRCSGRHELPFIKIGRAVRYRKSDLDAWLARRTVTSTSQAEEAGID